MFIFIRRYEWFHSCSSGKVESEISSATYDHSNSSVNEVSMINLSCQGNNCPKVIPTAVIFLLCLIHENTLRHPVVLFSIKLDSRKKAFCQDLEKRGLLDLLSADEPDKLGFSFEFYRYSS